MTEQGPIQLSERESAVVAGLYALDHSQVVKVRHVIDLLDVYRNLSGTIDDLIRNGSYDVAAECIESLARSVYELGEAPA